MGGIRRVPGEEQFMSRVIVVGGGAAGLMAALFAARQGAQVQLLEQNEKLGKKIYITGKGRCNLTNTAIGEAFLANVPRNPRFLYSALGCLDNQGLMALMESLGLPLKEERGGRVFPQSDHASDVTRALENGLRRAGGQIALNARVAELWLQEEQLRGVVMEDGARLPAQAVVVATGGLSYPSTGSTGDGYAFARQAGLEIASTRPCLVGIETEEDWPFGLSGLTLKNVGLCAPGKKKPLFHQQGELLLTHFGISGPLALTLSSLLPQDCHGQPLLLDLKPALTPETLDARLVRDCQAMSRKRLATLAEGLAPHNLAMVLLKLAGLSPELPVNALTRGQRTGLVQMLKGVPLTVKGLRGYQEAVITRGGVSVRQINASTMEAKAVKGLFFAGEVLDVDALTGGFNLQIAFSTGALAGKSAAQACRTEE